MFTIKNPNLVLLVADNCRGNVRVAESSPLAKLIRVPMGEINSIEDLMAAFSEDLHHEAFLGSIEAELETILRTRIAFIRNTVIDTVEDINKVVEDGLQEEVANRNKVNIVQRKVPDLLESEFFVSMVDKHKNVALQQVTMRGFPELSSSELVELATSVIDDAEIVAMINDLIDSFNYSIVSVYNKHFRDIKEPTYPTGFSLNKPSYIGFTYIEQALVYLLATAFYSKPHPAVNLSLQDYNTQLAELIAQTGRKVHNGLIVLKNSLRSTKLVVTTDRISSNEVVVVVDSKVYSKFLDLAGAKPETLIGLYSAGKHGGISIDEVEDADYELGKLIEAGNKAFSAYNNYTLSIVNDKRRASTVRIMMAEIGKIIKDPKFPRPLGRTDVEILEDCRKVAQDFGTVATDATYIFIREVVSRGLYPNSGASIYLRAMDRYQKENPNLQPREAATLAMRDVLVEWSANQIEKLGK